jgi:hypothetical protein
MTIDRRTISHAHTEATKRLLSRKLKGIRRSQGTRAKMAASKSLRRPRAPDDLPDDEWDTLYIVKLQKIAAYDHVDKLLAEAAR